METNNSPIRASLIISVYNNITALKTVLDSLSYQTATDFEVIISEDGENDNMRSFVQEHKSSYPILHLTQPDNGWMKNQALNNSIRQAKADWLIFIDGDCVLHPRFIEMHLRYANKKYVLAGKRVKLNEKASNELIANPSEVQRMNAKLFPFLLNKKESSFVEEGFFISPDCILGFIPKLRKLNHLKGCNMSFSKEAIYAINGFDEDYILPAVGEDYDLSWRFEAAGYKHFSIRNLAVQYHLYHKENWTSQEENLRIYNEKKNRNEYICKNGIKKLGEGSSKDNLKEI